MVSNHLQESSREVIQNHNNLNLQKIKMLQDQVVEDNYFVHYIVSSTWKVFEMYNYYNNILIHHSINGEGLHKLLKWVSEFISEASRKHKRIEIWASKIFKAQNHVSFSVSAWNRQNRPGKSIITELWQFKKICVKLTWCRNANINKLVVTFLTGILFLAKETLFFQWSLDGTSYVAPTLYANLFKKWNNSKYICI